MRISEGRVIDLSDLVLSSEQSAIRSPGIHVSAIIRAMARELGRKQGNEFTAYDLDHFAVVGRLWEAQLAVAKYPEPRYVRVGELECDGIIGSPDSIDTVDWAVQEFKCTWRSASKPPESEFDWMTQIKAYCHMLSMCRAVLTVFYVGGVWRPPHPIAKEYTLLFAPGEVEDNWRMLLANKGLVNGDVTV